MMARLSRVLTLILATACLFLGRQAPSEFSPLPVAAPSRQAAGQQLPLGSVTFESETRAVQINVSVKDAKGNPVRGLRKEDFAVTDNGKPREIVFVIDHAEKVPTDN